MLLYFFFSYELIRGDFNALILSFTALFLLFLYVTKQQISWKALLGISILFRLVFLVAIPNLSQDFYRFIWDGRMLMNGFNPYLYLPENYLNPEYLVPQQAAELVKGMQELNASHYSNYPPLNQLCFAISGLFAPNSIIGSIVVMRLILIAADIGVIYYGGKLLKALHLNPKLIFLYILNPFIIIELTGNLHFEGLMIFFLIWGLYLFKQQRWIFAAIIIGLSVNLKLLPLLFLPLFFKQLKFKQAVLFYSMIGLTNLILFAPFISENLIQNYSRTIGLWFGNFEFNGSIHNIINHTLRQFKVYDGVQWLGKIVPLLVLSFVLTLTFFKNKKTYQYLLITMLFSLSFYLFTTATVHPWYVAMLLAISIFTPYRFPLLWSFTIMLSYSFYKNEAFINNYWLIALEYSVVFGMLVYELKKHPKKDAFLHG